MHYQLLAIQLANLATTSNQEVKDKLSTIVSHLFTDLECGHSCSKLSEIAQSLKTTTTSLLDILNNSGIAIHIQNDITPLQPISIVKTPDDYLVYISKYLVYETNIIAQITKLNNEIEPSNHTIFATCIDQLTQLKQQNNLPNSMQFDAIMVAITHQFSIITGGPGTGKTTTVTLLLWTLLQLYGNTIQIRICAPTGKASSRVKESILSSIDYLTQMNIDTSCFNNLLTDNNFTTIHKLLGYIHQNIYFKYNNSEPLDIDILIIDESSMISLPLFSKLLNACDPNKIKHIICLGDKNQLSSVEEGYVLASLLDRYNNLAQPKDSFSQQHKFITELTESNRNHGDIGKLAQAILLQNLSKIHQLLHNSLQLKLLEANITNLYNNLFINKTSNFIPYLDFIKRDHTEQLDYNKLFKLFTQQNILCLTNVGTLGTYNINQYIEKHTKLYLATNETWYTGRPIIILENNYSLGLSNGDIGICVIINNNTHIRFENGNEYSPEILPKHNLAYAITIHKSQGSEYSHVHIMLSNNTHIDNIRALLSRELIYTAVTRAKNSLTIYSDFELLSYSVKKDTMRNSGIPIIN